MLSDPVNIGSHRSCGFCPQQTLGEVMTARVRVRVDELGRIATAQGLRTRYALAKRLGVNRSTVGRVLDGDRAPGQQFIAATIRELGVGFDAVFEVVDGVVDEVPA
jgi:hypothetical protein